MCLCKNILMSECGHINSLIHVSNRENKSISQSTNHIKWLSTSQSLKKIVINHRELLSINQSQ